MKKILFILAGVFTAGISHGATVNWNAFIDTGVIAQGAPAASAPALALNNWVQIGYFKTLSDAQVTIDAATLSGPNSTATLATDFFTFGSLQITPSGANVPNSGQGAAGPGGWQQATNNFLYSANPTFVTGHQLYFWAMNSTSTGSLGAAEASVTQQAIFTLPTWTFPASDVSSVSYDITSLSSASRQMLYGTYIPSVNNTNLTAAGFPSLNNAVQLGTVSPVPEPSSLTFGALAALVAAGSRRRKRQ